MGHVVKITYQRRPEKFGLTTDEAVMLADEQARAQGLPARCQTCGSAWSWSTAAAMGREEDWTITYRCPNGDD